MVDVEKPLVTITGMTGYIGAETTLQFLQDGGYRIRGTVRDKNNQAKIDPLRQAFGAHFDNIELVEADLTDDSSLQNAVAGSTYVVHIASPVSDSYDTEESLVGPAVNGTMSIVRACAANGVRRCVITSSVATVINMDPKDAPATFNESCWSNPDRPGGMSWYGKSKTLAEKAAWDFQASLPEANRMEIVTILPGFVMGPPLRKESFASGNWIRSLMIGKMEDRVAIGNAVIKCDGVGTVDVRDVALAHLRAVKVAEAANKRFLLVNFSARYIEYA